MTRAERDATDRCTVSRRGVLRATAAFGLLGAVGPAAAQEGAEAAQDGATTTPTTEYQLGAQVSGWTGQKPGDIEGKENPTLGLEAGRTYTISWVNLDGQQHQLQILDTDGETVAESDLVSTQGATGVVAFEATPKTVSYRCSIHTSSMQGKLQVASGSGTTRGANAEPGSETVETAAAATTTTAGEPETETGPSNVGTTGTEATGTTTSSRSRTVTTEETPAPGGQPGFGVAAGVASFVAAGLARLARRGD